MRRIEIDGDSLTLEQVEEVATNPAVQVAFAPGTEARMQRSRDVVERALASGATVYGVTTGFGRLAETPIPADRLAELQLNLIRSHACGFGIPLGQAETRAIMLLRANVLAKGFSGIRPVVVQRLLDLLNHGVHPIIPEQGSVGASGDLAPLSHLALVLIGEGEAEFRGERMTGAEALRRAGLEPVRLQAKEGLALNNGTQVMAGIGALLLRGAERVVEAAEVAGAMSLEGLRGTPDAFHPAIMRARPHPGQAASAERLRGLLADSEIRESHRYDDPRVQDAYAIRCMPQIHGAARNAFAYIRQVLETEANSATDNPLIFPDEGPDGLVISGGNFHGQPVAQVLDLLAMALTDLGSVSERRTERLVNPDLSGDLPAFLTADPGVCSGFMIAQITAAALVSENKVLSHPASVDSIPTGANKEDHVSMGAHGAIKARRVLRNTEAVLGIELLCAAQALEFRKPLRPGRGVERAYDIFRATIPPLEGDRVLAPDIEAAAKLVRDGALLEPA
ncbi:histidine ammonia-lyase [Longimicrobium terrae]|uniref:Histidine ammonia-lyase n=1 Tax=Longimicrobium terrae TaxID=1639882 RepID=A0A841GIY9_9BACT|nr:histidine ammonia-lyase [Longimicrobium terrae]MBB4634593.1 histidine ammonia-lyase [Longimicrobium terrae]MBB6068517.1 histidine ammonia-lyase [Longimicrobium terrae]NNC27707.1 histidine ammonia-lyase [Longimicrobium terrae]